MRDIAVAIALYNNEKEVIEFAKALLKQTIIDRVQLLVTCNACKNIEKFRNILVKILPSALVFEPKENRGYLNGCLYGVKKTGNPYSWVMVSNTDVEFKQNDFFEKAINEVEEDVWCIGPDITLSTTGVTQNPFLLDRPTKRRIQKWKVAYSNYPFFWLYFKLSELKPKKKQKKYKTNQFVYAVHGSCFLLKKECAEKIMDVCQEIFMYGEELLVAEVVFKNNKKTYCNLSVGIIHNENQVTGKINLRRKQKWFKKSLSVYNKYL